MRLIDEWAQRWSIAGHPCVAELKQLLGWQTPLTPDPEAKTEADVQALIRIEASNRDCIMLRNNNGAMQGEDGRHVRFGLGNDSKRINKVRASHDLIGITPLTIESHHVGKKVGVFTSVEVKTPGWKNPRPSDEREQAQANFANFVRAHYGIAGFCTSVDDYIKLTEKGVHHVE